MKPIDEFRTIDARRQDILSKIQSAAKKVRRQASEIDLVAVSKLQPDDRIADMLTTGQTIFGENRVQEAQKRWGERFAAYRDQLSLRLIGPLQSNKAEAAVALFDVIETVDRDKLVKALVKASDKIGRRPKIYVQVNTGEEPQKSGLFPSEVEGFVTYLTQEYDWQPQGLMCIPPQGEAPSPHFWLLANLAERVGLSCLSMGMSADFEIAVKMGATSIRVGSALFGARE